jgi:hypothetical protein
MAGGGAYVFPTFSQRNNSLMLGNVGQLVHWCGSRPVRHRGNYGMDRAAGFPFPDKAIPAQRANQYARRSERDIESGARILIH